ncbi:MAG: hypothetical protein V4538_08895 [Bacteroidota bacterium]
MKYIIYFFFLILIINSCRKDDEFTSSPVSLNFSTDTLNFDTIFSLKDSAMIGLPKSITLQVRVTNPNENAVKTNISLAGNQYGVFKLNADGISGSGISQSINDVEIRGKDSIYIFVQAYINQNNQNTPFVVYDNILFNTNGKAQNVNLVAWGQDAHFLRDSILPENTTITWNDDKPYVIYNSILVPNTSTLKINPGVKVYSHVGSSIFVNGSLNIDGTADNPVVLQGDRLDDDYKEVAGQWQGVHLLSLSKNNKIKGAVIKNGFIGVRVDSLSQNANPKLTMSQTIVQDMSAVGVLCYSAQVKLDNNVVSHCGQYNFIGEYGGDYELTFNTFAGLGGSQARRNASVVLSNTPYVDVNNVVTKFSLSYNLRNNIIWGSNEDEIDFVRDENGIFGTRKISFNNIRSVLFRDEILQNTADISNNQIDSDPLFVDFNKKNFRLKAGSPCIGAGLFINTFQVDVTNKFRNNPNTSIGAYEAD